MKILKLSILNLIVLAFVVDGRVLAATECAKNANKIMPAGYESKNTSVVSNVIAIKNAAENSVKKVNQPIAVAPVPNFNYLQFVIYKDKVDILNTTTNAVVKTYSTKDAVAGRVLFVDFYLGRDAHGMPISGSYLIDLKRPTQIIATYSPAGAITNKGKYVVYEQNIRGNTAVGIYDLKAGTNVIKQLPNYGFNTFLKFSPGNKYLLASSPVNTIYAIPLTGQGPVLSLNIPVPQGEGPFGYSVTAASFIGKDKAKLTLANGKTCVIKITNTGITLVSGPTLKTKGK